MRLEIKLLGPFEVTLDGIPVSGFESSKVRALLAYLAGEARRPLSREHLAGLLWPDWPQKSAMDNLRYALSDLRKNVGDREAEPPFLHINREALQLNLESDCIIDTIEFERRRDVELYRGTFMENFTLSESPGFEDWIRAKGEYFRREMLETLVDVSEQHFQAGAFAEALEAARRVIEIEAWHEPAHRQAMRSLEQLGRRVEAITQFESLRRVLQSELQVEPSEETQVLAAELRSEKGKAVIPLIQEEPARRHNLPAEPARFIEREQELPAGLEYPSGTVTFLFTDIQGSTPLWERQPEKMAEALQIHHTTLRGAIEAHGGVVFKTVGDTFQAAFSTAPQALQAAIAGQKALQAAPWNALGELKVRIGLHTGEAELDAGGDEYAVSHTKNRAARIMSAAHGGQVLVSAETAELVDHQLPQGVTLKDLGEHTLKGMEKWEHLFQVCAHGLTHEFPALSTTVNYPNNLPVQVTSFIGREKEIATVCHLLESHRLVTLTGSGGTGKTRLSLEVARKRLENYPNGAWLVELAPLADPELIPKTVATALNLPEIPSKTIQEALTDFLRPKKLLLILDNCEHLLEACAGLADQLIHACPELTILASSREFLGVEGEAPYRVPPMALPDLRHLPVLEALAEYDAVHLFIERAQIASPEFSINIDNAATVVQVVTRLDGIPLAIELAASRLRLLGIEQLSQRLDDAFRLLTGGSRSKLPRHQTLRACIDWSYNLLSEPERILLRRLSVFAGGWSLQAAEAVCEGGAIHPDDILDLLTELLDKSLIHATAVTSSRNRYRMLETVRQYAHEKLVDEGEAQALRTRHLGFFLKFTEALEPKIRSREQIETLDRLEAELDNLRLALEWGLQTDLQAELRLAAALKWLWHIRYYWTEGIQWLENGLKEQSIPDLEKSITQLLLQARARALEAVGFQRLMVYQQEAHKPDILAQAHQSLEESVSIFKSYDPEIHPELKRRYACALLWLGVCCYEKSDLIQFQELARQALSLFREAGDAHGIAESLQCLADLETDPVRRINLHLEQLAIDEANGDIEGMATAQLLCGLDCIENGDYREAELHQRLSLAGFIQAKNSKSVVSLNWMLGGTSLYLGDLVKASEWISQALAGYRNLGLEAKVAETLWLKSFLSIVEGKYEEASGLVEDAWRIYQATGHQELYCDILYLRARLNRLNGDRLAAEQHARDLLSLEGIQPHQKMFGYLEMGYLALQSGDVEQARVHLRDGLQALLEGQWIGWIVFILSAVALLSVQQKQMERAAFLFGSRWSRGFFNYLSPIEKTQHEAAWEAMRAELGETRLELLYEEGQTMTLEQAVALGLEVTSE